MTTLASETECQLAKITQKAGSDVTQSIEVMRGRLEAESAKKVEVLREELSQRLNGESERNRQFNCTIGARMDELDSLYDDMQDRVFQIDKSRRNNLVFYGVKVPSEDPDECEAAIRLIFNTYLQVRLFTSAHF